MKKKISSLLIAFIIVMTMVPSMAFAGELTPNDIPITEEYFPDEVFRECMISTEKEWYVGNGDGILSPEEIENIQNLYVNDKGIESLEGIKYLSSVTMICCDENFITELPELPSSLKVLRCGDNYLTKLPKLPDTLESLDCANNALTLLPELPISLTDLNCGGNSLTSLPQLPEGLTVLSCSENKLTSLPELPSTLTRLSCGDNQLKALSTLPNSLEYLHCSYNDSLATIPNLPTSLKEFYCQDSSLTSIPALPAKLTEIYLTGSKISGVLDISNLHYLKIANLWGNLLTGLKLSPKAKYERVSVNSNNMSSRSAVTGRNDIDWDNTFYFGDQKSDCEVHGHTLSSKTTTSKAYVSQSYAYEGSKYKECTKCGYDTRFDGEAEKIPAISSIKLSATSYTYNGKTKKPTVTVYDSNGKKISSANYSVSYASGRKNVGKYKVTVKFKGSYYTGSRYVTFKINPKGTSVSKLTKAKKAFTVKWKKQSGKMAKSRITGYQYRYSTSSKMTSPKTVTIKGYSKTSAKKTGLKAKKKYYIQVRTYMTVSGTKYYSSWSKAKAVTTK